MEARNRGLPEWFNRVRTGQLRLPRFQRHEAWGYSEVGDLLETVLRSLPTGSALILEIGDKEPFISRPVVGAPTPSERVTEHLLDGQQRITALWRSFHDQYPDRTFFVRFEQEDDGTRVPRIESLSRWDRGGLRYPVWANNPAQTFERGLVPFRLLRPGDIAQEVTNWCKEAVGNDADKVLALKDQITELRQAVATFNLPFLSLPVTTPPHLALDVFIKMNTNSARLTAYDILVAQVEARTERSLHDLVREVRTVAPTLDAYADPPQLLLQTASLREDRSATQASFHRLDLDRLVAEWPKLAAGVGFAMGFLEEEKIFDAERLATYAVLPVLAALHDFVPPALDARGNAKTLLRKYVWRAFVTNRYENQTATRSLQDFRGLRGVLRDGLAHTTVPIMDETLHPLPTAEELSRAGWPKGRDILGRAILGATLRAGAIDLADGSVAARANLARREYHHLFPDSLLSDNGVDEGESFLALNCALISWNTNRNIAAKEPVQYLRDRALNATLGEAEIRARLESHLIPYETLNVGGYAALTPEARRAQVRSDYERFLLARAERVLAAMRRLCAGEAA